MPVQESDYPAIVELANLAYRGPESWSSEHGYIVGTRLTEDLLRQELAAAPQAHLLTWRETSQAEIIGTVWLDPKSSETWYLGLLTVRPGLQDQGIGRALLSASEEFARARGAKRVRMTVVNLRYSLIAWYQRRGYALTGENEPFPTGDERFGKPLRDDLHFVVMEKEI
jgi:predicted N-acetyltransferase YhbS